MKIIILVLRPLLLALLVSTGLVPSTLAQEVSIPDPGLNAAVRAVLQKPNGPLTEQDLLGLTELDARFRNISSLQGLDGAHNLTSLEVSFNALTRLDLPASLIRLSFLDLSANQLASFTLPAGFTNLNALFLDQNPLTNVTLPEDLANLSLLRLCCSQLTGFSLPPGLTNLALIDLGGNQLTNLTLSEDLESLTQLDLQNNQLSKLTIPVGLTRLHLLLLVGNPLTTFVLSEPLAAAGLAGVVDSLQNQGVSVFTYPLSVQLVRPLMLIGSFKFGITGPPGVYNILSSTNLAGWSAVGVASNLLGSVNFHDVTAGSPPQKFYRAVLQVPPANMVFIPPNTFTMGSPTNDLDRSIFEGPQTTVTLTHGFWIGKYEVTQGEYLAVMGENPSNFPGDLNRPIPSVTWFDATNYCAKQTQRELAAGRIPAGSQYRLPTEAEWECAARAGTSTRFSYGDDPNYTSLTNYAWFLDLAHIDLTVHPVGQKLPNPWGLSDMYGNVWEWCQDWYGDQTGGVQTDPTGPASNPVGNKIMRGGAYDYPNSDCRSASRFFRFASWPDSDLGFRVVLTTGP